MSHVESFEITLEVSRTDNDDVHSFKVPVPSKNSRVLDALLYVRHNVDPSLGFRYSCRAGMCGSCAVVVNGKESLACQTTIGSLQSDVVRVEPMRALPVIKDVTCDMDPFFNTLIKSHSALVSNDPDRKTLRIMPPKEKVRKLIQDQSGCITCGACYSACEWSATKESYLGPSAINRILMLALDERDLLGKKRLRGIATDSGIFRCHGLGSCSTVCPVDIPLREGMQKLKGLISKGDFD
jgi:succinate dehydrogenase/fumarate reductase iron-sulfur protein